MREGTAVLRLAGRRIGLAALVHLVLFQLLSGVLVTLLLLLFGLGSLPGIDEASVYVASDAAMLIAGVVYLICYLRNRETVRAQTPAAGSLQPLALLGYMGLIFGINALLSSVNTVFTAVTGLSLTVPEASEMNADPWLLLITVAVFPAIVEEAIFRGLLYRWLRQHGKLFAALASSLIFGLIHLNSLQFFFAALMGLVLCRVYERSGKLYYAMLLHFFNNLLMVLPVFFRLDTGIVSRVEYAAAALFLGWLVLWAAKRKKRGEALLPAGTREALWQLGAFFTAVPMLLLTVLCLGICVCIMFF